MSTDTRQPAQRTDPGTGLPLPDPYPEYMPCPHCGELEVEVWCYQTRVRCHRCGEWIAHTPAICRGMSAICRAAIELESADETETTPD
ncbi:MAG: hypothetical protein ACT4QE_23950 [Anaerolineales bacterium]